MTKPDKLTVGVVEEIIKQLNVGLPKQLACQLLDTMCEVDRLKIMLEEYVFEDALNMLGYFKDQSNKNSLNVTEVGIAALIGSPNKESAIKDSLTTDNQAKA